MFQNIQNDQASYACITVSGFIFLRDAHWFVANRKEKVSSLLLLYKQARVWLDKYSTNWSPWQIDPRFSHKIARWRGGVGVQIERKISWGGGAHLSTPSGGGMLVWKKVSRFEISRSCHLCGGTTEKSIYLRSPPTGISAFSF